MTESDPILALADRVQELIRAGRVEDALQAAHEAAALAEAERRPFAQGVAATAMAQARRAAWERGGGEAHFDEALGCADRAAEIFDELGDWIALCNALILLAELNLLVDNLDIAQQLFARVTRDTSVDAPDSPVEARRKNTFLSARAFYGLGCVAVRQEDMALAKERLDEAAALFLSCEPASARGFLQNICEALADPELVDDADGAQRLRAAMETRAPRAN